MSDTENIMNFNDLDYVGKDIIENQEAVVNISKDSLQTKNEAKFSPTEINDKFQSISLPSGFMFYDFDTIKVRKFEIRDLAKMYKVTQTESYKLFKEVIQNCVDHDINQLTSGDFKYICYWLRLNSYPKSPMTIKWKSKYGNDNVAQVRKSELQVLAPDITKEQLEEWEAEGFCVPTLEFSSVFEEDLSEDDEFLYSNAQFFKGKDWKEKIETLNSYLDRNGLDALQKVKDFDDLVDHGVKEELTVVDSKFDPDNYKNFLQEKISKLKKAVLSIDVSSSDAQVLNLMLDTMETELATLVKRMDSGEVVQADPETIFLQMDAAEFLSPVLRVQVK